MVHNSLILQTLMLQIINSFSLCSLVIWDAQLSNEAERCLFHNNSRIELVPMESYTGFNPKLLCLAAKCKDIANVDKDLNT